MFLSSTLFYPLFLSTMEEGDNREFKLLMGITQTPHYNPLRDKPETIRKGVIALYDDTFVKIVGKIQSLTSVTELETQSEEIKETLEELQVMGYNITPLSKRLDVLEGAVAKAKTLGDAIQAKIDEEIRKMEEKRDEISEIGGQIMRLQVKAEEKQRRIDELVSWVEKLKMKMPDVESVFSNIARSPIVP